MVLFSPGLRTPRPMRRSWSRYVQVEVAVIALLDSLKVPGHREVPVCLVPSTPHITTL